MAFPFLHTPRSSATTRYFLRRLTALAASAGLVGLASCGTGINPQAVPVVAAPTGSNVLTPADVQSIVAAAAGSVNVPLVIAVSDRQGNILAVYSKANAPTTALANYQQPQPADEVAAATARTAAFFSNNQAPISSRTVRILSGEHFPPGILNTEAANLYGIESTNRGCGFNVTYLPGQSLPITHLLHSNAPGLGIQTGKPDLTDSTANIALEPVSVNPGGVPIFKNNQVAGAVGVVADPATPNYNAVVEYAAFVATFGNGFALNPIPYPGAVVVGGVTLPFVDQTTLPAGLSADPNQTGTYSIPATTTGLAAPEGDLIQERGSTLGGLTLAQVQQIVQNTVATGNMTRAAIRLPVGSRARFVIAVADLDGSLLALYRMPDATIFSVDVAVAKSRNVIYFSGNPAPGDMPGVPAGTAVTNRTINFASQPLYPSGIDGTAPGPFYSSLFLHDQANPCTQGSDTANPQNHNGIVFFPGSVPLYVNGKLAGGLGVSGDGVDQDDYATAGGAAGFQAAQSIRADNIVLRGIRLPFQKFPADPTD